MMLISGSLEANSSHDIVLFEERVASNHQQRVTAELARLSNAALEENNKNDLPLHLAMRNVHMERNDDGHKGVSDGILDALLSLNRDAVKHLNADGCLPLHIACQAAMDEQTIIRLVKVYPESVMIQCNLDIQFSKNEFAQDKEGRDDDSIFLDWSLDTCIKTCLGACMLCDEMNEKDDQAFKTFESALSPLHLAVLNSASPNIIDHILNANPMCLRLKSSQGRTALDMAESMSNTDDTIQVMKSLISNTAKSRRLQKFSKSLLKLPVDNLAEKESFNAKMMWKKVGNAIIFTNRLMLALGPIVDVDNNDKFKISEDFEIPAGLERNCVDVILPIGFHQLRWAFTSHQSSFYKEFHEIEMDCTEFELSPWDKFDDEIGQTEISCFEEKDFINVSRDVNFLMPKSGIIGANFCYSTETIVKYSDYCFAIKRVAKNPEVPYGKTFEAHCLDVFVNTGSNSCRMITSAEAYFYSKPPFIAWKIRTGMHDGITSKSVSFGNAICNIKAQHG